MTDATAHTAIAINVAASSASLAAGTILGVPFIVIGLALLGASISHIWITGIGRVRTVFSIIGSTVLGILAGVVFMPLVVAFATQYLPWAVDAIKTSGIGGMTAVSFWVAFLAHKGVPVLFKWLESKGENA